MKLVIEKKCVVITPTIGSPKLKQCIESVSKQTYGNVEHLVVIDGLEYSNIVYDNIPEPIDISRLSITLCPYNTGANGFYGHRIYAAYPHLINADYILFCDEDNWYKPNHIESLVNTIETAKTNFVYSLREIYTKDGDYCCEDNCESLGKWPIYFARNGTNSRYLIDTSSFLFERQFIQDTCHFWHWGWGGDRHFLENVKELGATFECSREHTLCYRLDGNPKSVTKDFFEEGNRQQAEYYKGDFPWKKIL